MANWTGVITNAGNMVLNKWVNEKVLTFDYAAAGQGTVNIAGLLAQTSLVSQRQEASLLGGEEHSNGIRIKIRLPAADEAYTMNQIGVWASVTGESPAMIALFQHEQGIPIPGKSESPDFLYTFYGFISCSNIGEWSVTVDTSATATLSDIAEIQQSLETHTGDKSNPHEVTAAQTGAIPVSEKGVAGGVAGLDGTGKVPSSQLPDMDYVPLSGGTMTGPLVLPGDPTASLQAAPKQYVDNALNDITPSGIGAAPASHTHAATDITSGVLPLARGGTGGASAAAGLYQLVNNTTALNASDLSATDCFGIADVSAGDGKKLQLGQLTTYLLNNLGAARIQTGSYVGTGTYGSSNPCSLTFDFSPQLFILFGKANSNANYRDMIIAIKGGTQLAFTISSGSNPAAAEGSNVGLTFSWGSSTLNWYATNLNYQLNASGVTYNWLAAGT